MSSPTAVLLIDDELVDRMAVRRVLLREAPGLQLIECTDVKSGLQAVEMHPPFDCIIVDYCLPDGNGVEFVRAVRQAQETPPPIVVMTGATCDRGIEALRAGAEDYLQKCDIGSGDLLRAVRHAIERHRIRTELARSEAALRRFGLKDPLTGLLNQRSLEEALSGIEARKSASALLVDCDGLEPINRRHGHSGGDQVLCLVTRVLRDTLRDADLVFRVGGDEFAVLLPDTRVADAVRIAERVQRELARRVRRGAPAVTVSIGAFNLPNEARTARGLLRRGRAALDRCPAPNQITGMMDDQTLPEVIARGPDAQTRAVQRILDSLPRDADEALALLEEAMACVRAAERSSIVS